MRRIAPYVLLLVLLVLLTANVARAQAPRPAGAAPAAGNGELRGTVVDDKSGLAAPRASVAVRAKGNNAVVAGAIATATGAFRVPGLRAGAYVMRVTSMGFAPKTQEFTITPDKPLMDAGEVRLSRIVVNLQGVQVVEERDAIAAEPDRNSYRAKDVAPAAANASEVLGNVPSVQVDGDGKVSLRGNENVAVQVNGRPSPITGTQLAAYLKSLPANVIDHVEVIPNPSAKYDPDGMAGIINIVLKQNVDLGMSGGFNASLANANRYNGSGNFGYQSGPLTTFMTVGYNNQLRPVEGINDRQVLMPDSTPRSFTNQDIASDLLERGVNLTANADYKLTDRDVLTNGLTLNHRRSSDATFTQYTELDSLSVMTGQYDRLRGSGTTGNMIDYTLALKRTLEQRKHEISAELRANRSHDEDGTDLWRQPVASSSASATERERDATDAITKSLNAQLDYMKVFAPFRLESGYKGTFRQLDRDYTKLTDSLGTGNWTPSSLSNAFAFDEAVHAVYGVATRTVGKVDLQGGLRAEAASRDFRLASSGNSYPYSYRSLFPSGLVSYNVNDATTAKISYSRRIRRPGTQELNPFPTFMDIQNVFLGNPSLNPEYTDAVELGLTRTGSLGMVQLSPFYRHTKDVIRVNINTTDTIAGREVTSVSFRNLATSNSWGTDLTGNLKLGPKLTGFATFNVFKMVTDGGTTSVVGSDAVTWSTRFNATTELSPTVTLQGSWFYRAPMNIEGGRFEAMQMSNFSLRRKIDGDNSSVTLRVMDPFNTGQFRVTASDGKVIQRTERSFGARAVYLTFQYAYGQAPRIRQPKPDDTPQASSGFP